MGNKKPTSTSWPKGVSGNPTGRPKQTDTYKAFQVALQEFSPEGASILISAIKSGLMTFGELNQALRTAFAYAWGNPAQVIEATIEGDIMHFVARMPITQEESKSWVSENKLSSGSPNPAPKQLT
jgi:hypothetical protein